MYDYDEDHNPLEGLYDELLCNDAKFIAGLKEDASRAKLGLPTGLFLHSADASSNLSEFEVIIPKYAITLVAARTGGGKCLQINTPILMADGTTKNVQDIEVGDMVMGDDSAPRKVLSLTRGRERMYDIVPVKGDAWGCNESHILSLVWNGADTKTRKNGEVYDISVREYLTLSKKQKHCLKQFRVGVDYPYQKIEMDPYILGVWLGDGHQADQRITASAPEIVESIIDYAEELSLDLQERPDPKCNTSLWSMVAGRHQNTFLHKLDRYGLREGKHIPLQYLANDRQTRLELLAGLIDTDGYLHHNFYEIVQKRKRLSDNILQLARSLGFAAYAKEKIVNGVTYYRMNISGHVDEIPCRVAYKKATPRKQKKDVLRTGFKVIDRGMGDYYGFEIDGNNRFLLGDHTVTHNSTTMIDLSVRLSMAGNIGMYVTLEEPAHAITAKMMANYSARKNAKFSAMALDFYNCLDIIANGSEPPGDFMPDVINRCRVIDANKTIKDESIESPHVLYYPQHIMDLIKYRNDVAGNRLDFVFIDFGQLLESYEGHQNSYQRIRSVMQALKNMSGSLGIAVIIGAQMKRECYGIKIWDWEPELIRDGSDMEQAASLVIAIGKDKEIDGPEDQVIRYLKNRNGPKRVAGMVAIDFPHSRIPDKSGVPKYD